MKYISSFSNLTKWDDKDLKNLCQKVIKHEGTEGHHIIIKYHKKVWYSEQDRYVSGQARINGTWIIMRVCKTKIPTNKYNQETQKIEHSEREAKFPVNSFAVVLMHEIGHNRGLRHKDMLSVSKIDSSFVNGLGIKPR